MPNIVDDLTIFFTLKSSGGFADPATLQGGSVINVIFDAAYQESFGIAGTNPGCVAKAADVSTANIGQTLTINSTVYTIRNRVPQDDGAIVQLELKA